MEYIGIIIGGLISALLLYQGIALRQFGKSNDDTHRRLERAVEALIISTQQQGERLSRLEGRFNPCSADPP
jgi:hypothetical protein